MFLTEEVKVMVNSIQVAINNSMISGFWNIGGVNDKLKQLIIDICCQLSSLDRSYFEEVDFNFYEHGLSDRLEGIIANAYKAKAELMEWQMLEDKQKKLNVHFPFTSIDFDEAGNRFFSVRKVWEEDKPIRVYPTQVDSFIEKNKTEIPF
jgi:hypothetical protein